MYQIQKYMITSLLFLTFFTILLHGGSNNAPTFLNTYGNTITGFNDSNESVDINLSLEGTLEVNGSTIDGYNTSHPSFVDIDDDGDYDMFVGNSGGKVKYFENNGSQNVHDFLTSTNLTANGSTIDVGSYSRPCFVDLDDDDDYDLVVGEVGGKLYYYENNGSKTSYSFKSGTKLQANGSKIDVGVSSRPIFVDLDDDGDYDLVVGETRGKLYYYENNGSKTVASFVEGVYLTANGSNIDIGQYPEPSFLDIDDDGDYDLVVGEYDGILNYFENSGTSTNYVFESGTTLQADGSDIDIGGNSAPTFVDLDSDGKQDLVLGEYDGKLYYYKNSSDTDYSLKYSIEEGETSVANIESYDEEGDSVTYGIDSSYEDGAFFTFNGTTLAFITAPDYENPSDVDGNNTYDVNITISDGGESSWTVVEVSVSDVTPTFETISDVNSTEDSEAFSIELNATDEDGGDSISYTATSSDESIATVSISGSTLTITPVDNANGSISITVTATANGESVQTFTVNIEAVNDAPSIETTFSDLVMNEDNGTSNLELNISDIDLDDLTLNIESNDTSIISVEQNWTNPISNGNYENLAFSLITAENANGMVEVTITVDDGELNASQTFSVTLNAINDAPSIESEYSNLSIDEDNGSTTLDVNLSDIDTDGLSLSVESNDTSIITVNPNWSGSLDSSNWNQTFDFTTIDNANGNVEITITVDDGELNSTKTFTISVGEVDDAPTLETIEEINTTEDSESFTIELNASDEDGDSISYTATSSDETIATVSISGNTLTVSPVENANGTVSIEVTATANAQSVSQIFSVNIEAVNDAPTYLNENSNQVWDYGESNESVGDQSIKVDILENETVISTLLGYDEENETVTFGIDTSYGDGALFDINIDILSFIDAPDFETPEDNNSDNIYDINLTISDGIATNWTVASITVLNKVSVANIVFRNNTTGKNLIFMQNDDGLRDSFVYTTSLSSNWEAKGLGDFNGDSVQDILFRNDSTGEHLIFFQNTDGTRESYAYTTSIVSNDWKVKAIGDFNGDSIDDIVFRNSVEGRNLIFFQNADGSRESFAYIQPLSTTWELVGSGKFDDDNIEDILFRNSTTGKNLIFFQNADGTRKGSAYTTSLSSNWKVAGVGNFNADTVADILFRNQTTGENLIFFQNSNGSRESFAYTTSLSLDWKVANVIDLDNDGISDILFRNSTNGKNLIFFQNVDGSRKSFGYTTTLSTSWEVVK